MPSEVSAHCCNLVYSLRQNLSATIQPILKIFFYTFINTSVLINHSGRASSSAPYLPPTQCCGYDCYWQLFHSKVLTLIILY